MIAASRFCRSVEPLVPSRSCSPLSGAEPIADEAPELRYSLDPPDAADQFWAQQPGIGRLVGQAAHCWTLVDAGDHIPHKETSNLIGTQRIEASVSYG
jgi:hypothetical protein